MPNRSRLCWLSLALAIFMAGSVCVAGEIETEIVKDLNRVARDLHHANQITSQSQKAAAAAFVSIENLRRTMSRLEDPEEINAAIEQLRVYGMSVGSDAEKKAFEAAAKILEDRVKFLAQMENPSLNASLQKIHEIKNAFAKNSVLLEPQFARRQAVPGKKRNAAAPRGLLGAHVKDGKTHFSVYSSAATEVNLVVFKNAEDRTGTSYKMTKGAGGIWAFSLPGELYGTFYGFSADGPKTDGHLFDPSRLLSDPYAFANVDHDGKSVVVDRNFKWTDQNFKRPAAKDAIIYEMHIKDYSAHKSAGVPAGLRGKYLGLLQGKGTDKVLGHLKDLGVNYLELLPVHEFDNNFAGVTNHWGYMTSHFFAPESSFASGKNGQSVKEFKTLVNGLHKEGFGVIMDVVFNHTAEGDHRGLPLNFKGLDNPAYYRLMDNKKYYWNGTGCGNEFRSDSQMGGKVILDSLKYWYEEYHIDGFRFDLGTIIDKNTMGRILNELPKDVIIVAEPWAADWNRNLWGKSDFQNTRLGKWNDDYRENIRAFVSGNGERNNVMTVIAGSCYWWAKKPTESLNYLEAHDGYTLFDLFRGDVKKTRLAAITLLTSQGIPMIHEGQEFNRSKKGNHNSYDQDNEINWIDWNVKSKNRDIFELYKGLIGLRNKYDNFKHATALNSQNISWIEPANHRGLGYILHGAKTFIVLLNGDQGNWINFQLPGGTWKVVCDGEKVKEAGLYTAEGDYNVPPATGIILSR